MNPDNQLNQQAQPAYQPFPEQSQGPVPQLQPEQLPPPVPVVPPKPQAPAPQPGNTQVLTPEKKSKFPKFLLIFFFLLLIMGGGGVYLFYIKDLGSTFVPTEQANTETTEGKEEIAGGEISLTDSPTIDYTNHVYKFSLKYHPSWVFACIRCDETTPKASESGWTILTLTSSDFALDEENKIERGASLNISARDTKNGARPIEEFMATSTDYFLSEFNDISGALNLNPAAPTNGFIYTNQDLNLDIALEWREDSQSSVSGRDLKAILNSFQLAE